MTAIPVGKRLKSSRRRRLSSRRPSNRHPVAALDPADSCPPRIALIWLHYHRRNTPHVHLHEVGASAELLPGGRMTFPNAVIRASKVDAHCWLNDANENAAPAFLRPMFEGDRASLKPYIAASRFLRFDPTTWPA